MKAIALACLAAALTLSPATAQNFPSKTVTVIVPTGAGGSVDLMGRFLADKLSKRWNQTVIVENRAGAGFQIGTDYVARSQPDGHTILFTSSAYTTLPAIRASLPYDPLTDLRPVAMMADSPFMLVVGPRAKAANLTDFLSEAKTRQVLYSGGGAGTAAHLGAELFNVVTGINMQVVQYKGGSEGLIDLVGGRTDAYVGSSPILIPLLQDNKVRPLAIMGEKRLSLLPDVPTLSELGVKGADAGIWWGAFVPGKTSDDIVNKIHADIQVVMNTPEAADFLAKQQANKSTLSPAELKKVVADEINRWKKIAQERGIKEE